MENETKTYQVIGESAEVLNLNREVVKNLKNGDTVTGTIVLVSGDPYLETSDGYVSTKSLAEKVSEDAKSVETIVKANSKKLLFAVGGAGLGYGVAHFRKMPMKFKIIYSLVGLVVGLFAEMMIDKKLKK